MNTFVRNLAPIAGAVLSLTVPLVLQSAQSSTAELHQNIEYARPGGAPLALDAFIPAGKGPFPAVVIVHGGGFTGGDRRHAVAPLREALSKGGLVWFSIDYRLAPAYQPSDASEDLNAALGFVRDHAREFKVDASRIALLGESAGGYLALMAAARLGVSQIQGVVAIGGPAQLWTLAPEIVAHVEGVFRLKGEAELRAVSPISCVSASMPPVLLLHGSNDNHVPLTQAQALCSTVQAKDRPCELHVIQGGGHSANDWVALRASGGFPPILNAWLLRNLAR
jgi:acetyl esterase/lipase